MDRHRWSVGVALGFTRFVDPNRNPADVLPSSRPKVSCSARPLLAGSVEHNAVFLSLSLSLSLSLFPSLSLSLSLSLTLSLSYLTLFFGGASRTDQQRPPFLFIRESGKGGVHGPKGTARATSTPEFTTGGTRSDRQWTSGFQPHGQQRHGNNSWCCFRNCWIRVLLCPWADGLSIEGGGCY